MRYIKTGMCECVIVEGKGGGVRGDPIEMGGMWSRRRGEGSGRAREQD